MRHLVGYAQNDLPVYVDLVKSKAAKQIAREPHLLTLATEVLGQVVLDKPVVNLEYDMKRVIGYDFVVKTTATDIIFYAQLMRDTVYTRFTKSAKPLPTRRVSIILQQGLEGDSYWVHDLWIGRLAPPQPGSAEETAQSKRYWEDHALIFDNQPIQPRTLTKTRPY